MDDNQVPAWQELYSDMLFWKFEGRRGDPYPYAPEAFTARAAKRILLCQA